MSKGKIYTFVAHCLSKHYEDAGWQYVGNDDAYSAEYVWAGQGTPVFPCNDETRAQAVKEFDDVFGPPESWEANNG